jgi:hypothetical protein
VRLEAKVWSTFPLTKILIYHNGKVWKEFPPNSDRTSANFEEDAVVSESGWFVLAAEGSPANLRADPSYPQAVTNAIRIQVGDQKIRSRASAEYFMRWIDKLRGMAKAWVGWRSEAETRHVLGQLDEARSIYERLAREAER